jgi:3-mercaptopyruvate sulfurtransferase SseA
MILVIDVRTAQEFSGQLGHIPGAVNIPIAELPDRIQELKNTKVPILAV